MLTSTRRIALSLFVQFAALTLTLSVSYAAEIIWAATDNGPFRSTDNGVTWIWRGDAPGIGNAFLRGRPSVFIAAVDPQNPDIAYFIARFADNAYGLLRTTDAGNTFSSTPFLGFSPFGGYDYQNALAIDPVASNVLYLLSQSGGILKSTDSGATWKFTPYQGSASAVVTSQSQSGVVYAVKQADIWKSVNFGENWDLIARKLNLSRDVIELPFFIVNDNTNMFVEPRNGQVVFAFFGDICYPKVGPVSVRCGLFRSADSGVTWSHIPVAGEFYSIAHSQGPSTYFATAYLEGLGDTVLRSVDGGINWNPVSNKIVRPGGYFPYDTGPLVYSDTQNTNRIFALAGEHPARVYRSDDGGANWTSALISTVTSSTRVLGLAIAGRRIVRPSPQISPGGVTNTATLTAGPVAPDTWTTVFGQNLAPSPDVASSLPLPQELNGTRVEVSDSQGTTRLAALQFVSTGQLNFLMPRATVPGPATITVTTAFGQRDSAAVRVAAVAPGMFSANASGRGPAAATFLLVRRDGARTEGFTFRAEQPPGQRENLPINLGEPGDQVFISFFGTGFRYQSAVSARIDELEVAVLGAVAQGQFEGLDQLVVGPLPRTLAGRADVTVRAIFDGISGNEVTLAFRP